MPYSYESEYCITPDALEFRLVMSIGQVNLRDDDNESNLKPIRDGKSAEIVNFVVSEVWQSNIGFFL